MYILNTLEKTSNLKLTSMNESNNLLEEVTTEDMYFAVSPYSVCIKKFYIIGDLIYENIIKVISQLDAQYSTDYTVKLLSADSYNSLADFNSSTNTVTISYSNLVTKPVNAIPLYILITSNSIMDKTVKINLTLRAETTADISVAFQPIVNSNSVTITGTTTGVVGDNIELTISGTGSANVLTNVVVQEDLTFTTAALDLSGFDAGSEITVTASKLNGLVTGFESNSDMAMLPPALQIPMQLRIDGSLYSGWTDLDVLVDGGGTVTVDWGDGSAVETGNNLSHTYSVSALCTAQVTASAGAINYVKFTSGSVPEIINFGNTVQAPNLRFALDKLVAVPAALPSYITSMNYMFQWCSSLNSPNLTNWNTANVTTMVGTFIRCDVLNQPLNWNTSNVVDFSDTFRTAYIYNQSLNHWNTSSAKRMYGTFNNAFALNQSFSNWDTSSVGIDDPTAMNLMFTGCSLLVQDFTMWCVTYINSTNGATVFTDSGMTSHPELQPVWGTCPAP